jgi:rhamnogalacturonyl hydrolase YesR
MPKRLSKHWCYAAGLSITGLAVAALAAEDLKVEMELTVRLPD